MSAEGAGRRGPACEWVPLFGSGEIAGCGPIEFADVVWNVCGPKISNLLRCVRAGANTRTYSTRGQPWSAAGRSANEKRVNRRGPTGATDSTPTATIHPLAPTTSTPERTLLHDQLSRHTARLAEQSITAHHRPSIPHGHVEATGLVSTIDPAGDPT